MSGTAVTRAWPWWRQDWIVAALAAALLVTSIDATLLQRKHNFFTGGFLTVDHVRGPGQGLLFLAGLSLTTLGITAPLAALALGAGRAWRLSRAARRLLALGVAALPLVVADVVSFRVLEYLGSAFDLGLMFDLAGRRPDEIAAVAGVHLLQLAVLVAAGAVGLVAAVWGAHTFVPAGREPLPAPPRARWTWFVGSVCLMALGLGTSTGLRLADDAFDNGFRRTPAGDAFGFVAVRLTDFDRDGFGLLGRPPDPAPFDGRIYPWAVDWPGNGIDENGVAGDLPVDYPPYVEEPSEAPRFVHRPDLVLIVLESFRGDAVGALLDGRPVTPVLDALAERGVSSTRAYSHNGYTVQSRFHLLSGSLGDLREGTTLIDDFKANGYEVAYFSGQDESFGGPELGVGYERADVFFDARQARDARYTTFATPGSLAVPAGVVLGRVRAFLDGRDRARPLFLYVNLHDTHFPYHHPGIESLVDPTVVAQRDIAPGLADALRRMYLNTAANVDRAIGDLLGNVEIALGEEPAVIVTADHGESLFDEGFLGHGYALNDVQTRIPLIVHGLGVAVPEPFGQTDLRGMIWEALSAPQGAPRLTARADRVGVFQYLGRIDRPAQVGFVGPAARRTYDFRAGWYQEGEAGGRAGLLEGAEREAFEQLVRFWESVVVARKGRVGML